MRFLTFVAAISVLFSTAHAQRTVSFADTADASDALIVAISDTDNLGDIAPVIGEDAVEALRRAVAATGYTAGAGATAKFVTGAEEFGEIHLIGVKPSGMRLRDWEDFGGRAGLAAKESNAARIAVIAPSANDDDLQHVALGSMLGAYAFDKYKSDAKAVSGDLVIVSANAASITRAYNTGHRHLADAVKWVRDMQSEPANVVYPQEFVRRARAQFRDVANISIEVLDVRAMERLGMNALLGVGRGSVRPPRLMIIRYNGGGNEAPTVFAGKGITFDSGGISLKKNDGMWRMKYDMSGAAIVTGATMALAKSRAPVNVIAVAALAENMPDGNAQRPGDVVKSMSGVTIEIMSTDAEGRLVLSDAMWYAQQEFKPALLVDVATLTGSVGRALGDEYAGVFSRDDEIAARLMAAGDVAGEDLWRLPMHPNHDVQIESVIADVKNGSTGSPGASTAAAFLGTFVKEETPWAHLDIAGVGWRFEETPTAPIGASGFGVRLLDRLARDGTN